MSAALKTQFRLANQRARKAEAALAQARKRIAQLEQQLEELQAELVAARKPRRTRKPKTPKVEAPVVETPEPTQEPVDGSTD